MCSRPFDLSVFPSMSRAAQRLHSLAAPRSYCQSGPPAGRTRPVASSDLVRRHRRPRADTEGSQHDFNGQRTKDESHYTDEDGRALSTDHPQNHAI
jgi:hypothetical protein